VAGYFRFYREFTSDHRAQIPFTRSSAGFEVANLLLDLGDAGDESMSNGVDDPVRYHGELVLEAIEATAGKRLLFPDGTSNALLLFGNKSFGRISHVGSP
jgi:hypothetical protein